MLRNILIGLCLILFTSTVLAEDFSLSDRWTGNELASNDLSVASGAVVLSPQKVGLSKWALQKVDGPFVAGEILKFSADAVLENVRNESGKDALEPFDVNLHPRNVCIAIAQFDSQNRELSLCASERLLGTLDRKLDLEATVQRDVKYIELRLLASYMTGKVSYGNMRLGKVGLTPLQPVADVKMLTNKQGCPLWLFNGEVKPLAMYFGNNQYNRDNMILEEMKMATDIGVPVISFNIYLPSMISNSEQLKIIERFVKPFPNAFFMPRIWLGANIWNMSFPEEMMKYADGKERDYDNRYASASSEKWIDFTDFNLRELIKTIQRSPFAGQFAGLKLIYYQTGEWIFWDPDTAAGFDEPTRRGFILWLKEKYVSIDALNVAWKSKFKDFGEVSVPSLSERDAGSEGVFRSRSEQQNVIDFTVFYNSVNADVIGKFAGTVKDATGGRSLVGTFYGYLFENAWAEGRPQQGGHLGMEKLLKMPHIDVIGAPYSYCTAGRGFGLPTHMHGPFDGLNYSGKGVLLEEDTYTHLAINPASDGRWEAAYAPGYVSRTKSMDETLAVLKRNLGTALARNYMILWQNLFSEGRFNHQELWDMYKPYLDWGMQRAESAVLFEPQVAVLTDPAAIADLQRDAYGFTERWLYQTRLYLDRVDTTIGYYHVSEMSSLPESIRCLILLTPWSMSEEQKDILRQRFMRDGRAVVFCASTSFGTIKLKQNNDFMFPTSKLANGTVFGERQWGRRPQREVAPTWSIVDDKARPFARYTANGEISCGTKDMEGWTSVFMGSPCVPAVQWREIFRSAGCHLYLSDEDFSADFERPDFVQANDDFIMVQSATGGEKTINLPFRAQKIYRFEDGDKKVVAENCSLFKVQLKAGVPVLLIMEK